MYLTYWTSTFIMWSIPDVFSFTSYISFHAAIFLPKGLNMLLLRTHYCCFRNDTGDLMRGWDARGSKMLITGDPGFATAWGRNRLVIWFEIWSPTYAQEIVLSLTLCSCCKFPSVFEWDRDSTVKKWDIKPQTMWCLSLLWLDDDIIPVSFFY